MKSKMNKLKKIEKRLNELKTKIRKKDSK
jgi:hypothetical protein